MEIICENEKSTKDIAIKIAQILKPSDIISMNGDLGAGKTFFVRSVVQSFIASETVPSPTFTLVQIYETEKGSIWHFDLYRLKSGEEIYELGIEEAFIDGICFIEWSEKAKDYLPKNMHEIKIEAISENARKILISNGLAERLNGQHL